VFQFSGLFLALPFLASSGALVLFVPRARVAPRCAVRVQRRVEDRRAASLVRQLPATAVGGALRSPERTSGASSPSRRTAQQDDQPMRRRASRLGPERCQVRQTGLWRRSSTEAGPEGASSCLSPGREAAAHVGSKESAQLTKSVQEHSEQVSFLIYSPHMSRLISCLG